MRDEPPSKPKYGTKPGFGPQLEPHVPLPAQPLEMDDATEIQAFVPMRLESELLPPAVPPSLGVTEFRGGSPGGAAPGAGRGAPVYGGAAAVPQGIPQPSAMPQGGYAGAASARYGSAGAEPVLPGAPHVDGWTRTTPAVDIDLVYERRTAPLPDQPWVFLEIWTRNTIYHLDASLLCIDVVHQGSRRSHGEHPLLGARLVGGQSRDGDAMELSHPFPRPGSEAVFEQTSGKHVRFSQTSSVTRVVMRLRVLTVEPDQLLPTWEDVSGKWDANKPR